MEDRAKYEAGPAKSPTWRDVRGWLDGLPPYRLDDPALVAVRSGVFLVSELVGGDPVVLLADAPEVSAPHVQELGQLYALMISQRWALASARLGGSAEDVEACSEQLCRTELALISFYVEARRGKD